MANKRIRIGDVVYISLMTGMASTVAFQFLLAAIYDDSKGFLVKLLVFIFLACLTAFLLSSNKFRSVFSMWNYHIPEEDKK